MKPKRHLVIEFRLIKVSELILEPSRSFVTVPMHSNTGMTTIFKGISDIHDRLHPQMVRMENILVYHQFGYNHKWNQENSSAVVRQKAVSRILENAEIRPFAWRRQSCIILLFLRSNTSCYAGVEAGSELESESIISDRSRSRRHLKFVDSAALLYGMEEVMQCQITCSVFKHEMW